MSSDDDDKTRIGGQDESVHKGVQLNGIFEIDELIATGGMGEVYRGHNIQTGDPVAIKVVLREFARDQGILALFRKEASILNHLSHDAIVRYHVFSIDPLINRPYLAMEFVDGQSLGERMQRGPIDAREAHRMLARLASGLSVAHEAGIIHRDLSPDNIVLPGGNVDKSKIIDFGIARSANIGGGTLIGGNFAGKYNFVSPEQLGLFGGDVTERSDIYSLGLVIAGALRGTPIDMNGTPVEVIEKRRTRPDLSSIDAELRPLLEAMLEPDPQDRTQSAADIVEWLRANSSRSLPPSALQAPLGRVARDATNPGWSPPGSGGSAAGVRPLPGESGHSPFGRDSDLRGGSLPGTARPAAQVLVPQHPSSSPRRKRGGTGLLAGSALLVLFAAAGGGAYVLGLFGPGETTIVEPPTTVQPPKTEPTTVQPPATEPTPEPPATEPTPEPPKPPVGSPQWLASFDGGPCFFAASDNGAVGGAISGFAKSSAPFDTMRKALLASSAAAPPVAEKLVANDQCPVVDFLGAVRDAALKGPPISLSTDLLKSGESLRGKLSAPGSTVNLLLIGKDGVVYNLEEQLKKGSDDESTFSIKLIALDEQSKSGPEPHLIVALTSPAGIKAADIAEPQLAHDLFPKIRDEMRKQPNAGVSIGYFMFGG